MSSDLPIHPCRHQASFDALTDPSKPSIFPFIERAEPLESETESNPWHFIIQTDAAGHLMDDWTWSLREAIAYAAWWDQAPRYQVTYAAQWPTTISTPPQRVIPVGSLEWVGIWSDRAHHRPLSTIVPIYIPPPLRTSQWLGRSLELLSATELATRAPSRWFFKSATHYKGLTECGIPPASLPSDTYWVSNVIDLTTEWRAFVWHHRLVGLQWYAGDFTQFPSVATIEAMITAYAPTAPLAYTLDVGCCDRATVVIEVHPLVSCGLYGFADWTLLPGMIIAGWHAWLASPSDPPSSPTRNLSHN